jgi:hypothetical protein
MNGRELCSVCSECVVSKEYNIARNLSSEHKEKCKNYRCSKSRQSGGLRKNRMPSENGPVLLLLHCGAVTMLLSLWRKKDFFSSVGNS